MRWDPTTSAGIGGALLALLLVAVAVLAFSLGQHYTFRSRSSYREPEASAPTTHAQLQPPASQQSGQTSQQPRAAATRVPDLDRPDPVGPFVGLPMPAAIPSAVL